MTSFHREWAAWRIIRVTAHAADVSRAADHILGTLNVGEAAELTASSSSYAAFISTPQSGGHAFGFVPQTANAVPRHTSRMIWGTCRGAPLVLNQTTRVED